MLDFSLIAKILDSGGLDFEWQASINTCIVELCIKTFS